GRADRPRSYWPPRRVRRSSFRESWRSSVRQSLSGTVHGVRRDVGLRQVGTRPYCRALAQKLARRNALADFLGGGLHESDQREHAGINEPAEKNQGDEQADQRGHERFRKAVSAPRLGVNGCGSVVPGSLARFGARDQPGRAALDRWGRDRLIATMIGGRGR